MKFDIRHFKELKSTNTLCRELAEEGIPEGLVIWTDFQTGGRGKLSRKWFSPAGKNLLFSLLIRHPISAQDAPMITQIACRSVASVLQQDYQIKTTFKRPNDILLDGKKICGILVESSTRANALEYAVIGIGLNVNAVPTEMEDTAVSMKDRLKHDISLNPLLDQLLNQLAHDLDKLYAHSA